MLDDLNFFPENLEIKMYKLNTYGNQNIYTN